MRVHITPKSAWNVIKLHGMSFCLKKTSILAGFFSGRPACKSGRKITQSLKSQLNKNSIDLRWTINLIILSQIWLKKERNAHLFQMSFWNPSPPNRLRLHSSEPKQCKLWRLQRHWMTSIALFKTQKNNLYIPPKTNNNHKNSLGDWSRQTTAHKQLSRQSDATWVTPHLSQKVSQWSLSKNPSVDRFLRSFRVRQRSISVINDYRKCSVGQWTDFSLSRSDRTRVEVRAFNVGVSVTKRHYQTAEGEVQLVTSENSIAHHIPSNWKGSLTSR